MAAPWSACFTRGCGILALQACPIKGMENKINESNDKIFLRFYCAKNRKAWISQKHVYFS